MSQKCFHLQTTNQKEGVIITVKSLTFSMLNLWNGLVLLWNWKSSLSILGISGCNPQIRKTIVNRLERLWRLAQLSVIQSCIFYCMWNILFIIFEGNIQSESSVYMLGCYYFKRILASRLTTPSVSYLSRYIEPNMLSNVAHLYYTLTGTTVSYCYIWNRTE